MEWGAIAAFIGVFIMALATHRLSLYRDRRKEFNEIAASIRASLARERQHGSGNAPSDFDLDRLVMAHHWWRRRACRDAVERYKRSKNDVVQEPVYGTVSYADPAKVHASIDQLMRFTEPR